VQAIHVWTWFGLVSAWQADDQKGVASIYLAQTIYVICEDLARPGVEDHMAMRIQKHLLLDYLSIVSARDHDITVRV
jgi:aminopeptidase-like protein